MVTVDIQFELSYRAQILDRIEYLSDSLFFELTGRVFSRTSHLQSVCRVVGVRFDYRITLGGFWGREYP